MARPDRNLESAAQEIFLLMQELLRAYQFRDVEAICSQGVSLTECHVLDVLAPGQPMGVNELADRLGLDKSTTSRAVNSLTERKLVRKATSDADARALNVQLTANGKRKHAVIVSESVACYAQLLAAIPAAERDGIVTNFRKLVSLLGRNARVCSPDRDGAPMT